MKVTHYSTAGPIKGVCRQSAVWGRMGGCTAPLIFLQRPKWITDDRVWEKIVASVHLTLPKDFEVK